MKKKEKRPSASQLVRRQLQNKKAVLSVYLVLRLLVIITLVLQIIGGHFQNVFVCILTLVLLMLPSMIERQIRIELPDALQIIIMLFVFAAEILGEIQEFYVLVPHWDTVLHTINGFLFAAIGFSIVNIFNENKRISMTLSPVYMAIAAFCFSMTIGILWEFFEWGMDSLFDFDMQKDTVLQTLSSVALHPEGRNIPVVLTDITDMTVIFADGTQQTLSLGGYLDMGLQDTMKDLLVNLIGAVVFSVIGYFYIKTKGKGKIAKLFIPQVMDADAASERCGEPVSNGGRYEQE